MWPLIEADTEARSVVLTGNGRAFSAGGDFEYLKELRADPALRKISLDSGKLYMADGALLDVRDGLTGRGLGQLTLPGLDERIAWEVSQGAGLLAEETRASVFELPA